MTGGMSPEEILDHAAREMAELMFVLTTECRGHERAISAMLARQLGMYVAVVAKKPEAALKAVAKIIEETPYSELRAEHYGYTLGVTTTEKESKESVGKLIQIGEVRGKPRP